MSATQKGGSISGKVFFNTGSQNVPNGTIVTLVNGSNVSEYYTGSNMTPDVNGYFQFTNVSNGFYKVYAWSPYYVEGYSAGVNVTTNDTYTASVVLLAMPYYANITASTQHVRYDSSADITIQVADYWGRAVGSGWQILMRTTAGMMNPDSAYTDKDGKVYSNLPWVDNRTPAEITAFAISSNGSSYGLDEHVLPVSPSVAPTATPSASAAPTASPTVVPNATATVTATPVPTPVVSDMPKPTPGFVLISALIALGIVLAFKRSK
jgi:hypothetical protein